MSSYRDSKPPILWASLAAGCGIGPPPLCLRSLSRGLLVAALLWVSLIACSPAGAQTRTPIEQLHLDEVVPGPDGEATVELHVRALGRSGQPVESLRAVDLAIHDNGTLVSRGVKVARLEETDRGAAFAVALDVSATMAGEPFESAKSAVLAFIDRMRPQDRVAVVAFSEAIQVVATFDASPREARALVEALEIDRKYGRALLYEGVFKAVDLFRRASDLPRRNFVVVLSDGTDGGSRATLDEIVDLAARAPGRSGIPIFTIGYDRSGAGNLKALRELSRSTAAEALLAQSADLIPTYFEEIWRQMFHSFVIRYPARLDGGHHSIQIAAGRAADTASAIYPRQGTSTAVWVISAALAAVIAIGLLYTRLPRGRGHLLFIEGPRKGETIRLSQRQMSIGALPDNDIVVPSSAVSRYHAQIYCIGRRVEVKDIGSSNGTYVNDTLIRHSPLQPGDRLRIGDVEMVYQR